MGTVELSRKIFRKTALKAEGAREIERKPLRSNSYVENQKSLVALVRTDEKKFGIEAVLNLVGGLEPAMEDLGYGTVLIKLNCNSHDPFPQAPTPTQ